MLHQDSGSRICACHVCQQLQQCSGLHMLGPGTCVGGMASIHVHVYASGRSGTAWGGLLVFVCAATNGTNAQVVHAAMLVG